MKFKRIRKKKPPPETPYTYFMRTGEWPPDRGQYHKRNKVVLDVPKWIACGNGDWEDMLDACLEIDNGLTEWEVKFLDDIERNQRLAGRGISMKQLEIIKRIYDEKAG